MNVKSIVKKIIIAVLSVLVVMAIAVGIFFACNQPTIKADFKNLSDVTNGASGYLYGLAEDGVPSKNMTESVDISTVAQKVVGGLQHPIGDIDHVYTELENTKYNVVYLQDAYDTWYYADDEIMEKRKAGTYDWKNFVTKDYLPRVNSSVKYLSSTSYSDKVVYCLYNECDNGIWFGTTVSDDTNEQYGVRADYDDSARQNFYDGWKMTYDAVKAINPNAIIGGPGFFEYNSDKISDFLSYCSKNDCIPDVMIYHELADNSIYFWQDNVKDYRQIEKSLGIDTLPIIVSEYGRMQDNGLPGKMVQYITQIELSKVYGDNAYWRLADNLCDVAADDNSPNSNWWLYRWYTNMQGSTADVTYSDIMYSNLKKSLSPSVPLRSKGFMGIASINDDKTQIDVICGGRNGSAKVKLKGLEGTALEERDVLIKVEESVYKGLSGVINEPTVIKQYKDKISSGSINIALSDLDEGNAYHIVITEYKDGDSEYKNKSLPVRYEAEQGTLLGKAYTYDSAYATTGDGNGMVGGMENDGDGVQIKINAPQSGDYNLDIIYGKANDGESSDDRHSATVNISIDDVKDKITLSNTIKSEYTNCFTYSVYLEKGSHTLTLTNNDGTYVVDSVLVTPVSKSQNIYTQKDFDRTKNNVTSYLAIAPSDGYYSVSTDVSVNTVSVNDVMAHIGSKQVNFYLQRGLNFIDFNGKVSSCEIVKSKSEVQPTEFTADKAKLSTPALLKSDSINNVKYIDGISCVGGKGDFQINTDKDGTYFLTITYANNDEGGAHDYNVDLIERYVTVTANGVSKDVYCRNTYSWDTYKTVTTSINLKKGENTVTLSNSGNNKFNGTDTFAPIISSVSVASVVK